MHDAVHRAISVMRANYYEPLTLRTIARTALVSPYHFSRMFHAEVGVPPGRYLGAVRLFEAKRLLLTTALNVADIVAAVGYSSVGTFTTKFTRAVGLSPTQFRDPASSGVPAAIALPDPGNPLVAGTSVPAPRPADRGASVGTLVVPAGSEPAEVVVGLLDDLIPCSPPASSTLVRGPRETVLAVSAPTTRCIAVVLRGGEARPSWSGAGFAGGRGHPVVADPGRVLRIDVRLHDRTPALAR